MTHPRLAVALAAALAAVGAAACAAPRVAVGTTRSPCFSDLPIASAAVGHQGTFAGVTRYTLPNPSVLPRRLQPRRPDLSTLPSEPSTVPTPTSTTLPRRAVCLVAFKGDFDPSLIPLLRASEPDSHYAIVTVTIRSPHAVAVYLRNRLPRPFTHL